MSERKGSKIVDGSEAMRNILEQVLQVAATPASVSMEAKLVALAQKLGITVDDDAGTDNFTVIGECVAQIFTRHTPWQITNKKLDTHYNPLPLPTKLDIAKSYRSRLNRT
jgi:hypothetical protein